MHALMTAHETIMSALPLDVPNPGAGSAPPGIGDKIISILGWAKWFCLGMCVLGLMIAGALMGVGGRRGQGDEHGQRVGFALGGAAVVAGAFAVVGFMAG